MTQSLQVRVHALLFVTSASVLAAVLIIEAILHLSIEYVSRHCRRLPLPSIVEIRDHFAI